MKIEIKSRWDGSVLFSMECDSWRIAVEAAIKAQANLRGANLRGADLGEANLREANLRGADLREADLGGADLGGADLGGADLREADLRGADLGGVDLGEANLRGADLGGADLRGADLRGANLRGADLGEANLGGADLTPIRDDLWSVLSSAPAEVKGLRDALIDGRIDGSTYEGECACLVGTLANVRHCRYDAISGLAPNSSRPAERWFLAIRPGHTPQNSEHAKLALQWIDQWLGNMRCAFAANKEA